MGRMCREIVGRAKRNTRKYVSLSLVLLLTMSLGGSLSFSMTASSSNDRLTMDVTIGSIGPFLEGTPESTGLRHPTQVRIEAVAEPSFDLAPTTPLRENVLAEKPHNGKPQGQPDPEPNDGPFGPDILVYDNPHTQMNPSIDHDSSSYSYIAYEHTESGDSDIHVAKSVDSGMSWGSTPVANSSFNESCPSIAIDYSPIFGTDMMYLFYEADELQFAYSNDGNNWSIEDFGGGITFWENVRCPQVAVKGDFIAIVSEFYDAANDKDTWHILYTLDSFQSGLTGYYWIMWDVALAYRPRVSMMDDDELFVAMDIYDQTDPDPQNWWHDTIIAHGILGGSGNPVDDNWDYWYWLSGISNDDCTSPSLAVNGAEVIVSQEIYEPSILPLSTHMIFCIWTNSYQGDSTVWDVCMNVGGFIAFDNIKDQKYPMLYRDGSAVHAVWLNGTEINYRYSPDGGGIWYGDPVTGNPLKVNEPGIGTASDAWHSPDVTFAGGKPAVAWHDTRGNGSIYFNTFPGIVWVTLDTEPRSFDLWVREVGDSWHFAPYYYLWVVGSDHEVEAGGTYITPGGHVLSFCYWSDGNTSNPHTITVTPNLTHLTAFFCCANSTLMVDTSPTGLVFELNGTVYTAPYVSCCNDSEIFKLYAVSPQSAGPGAEYHFAYWSDGGAQEHNVTVLGFVKVIAYFNLIEKKAPIPDAGGPYSGRKNFPVLFNGSGSYDSDETVVSYEWDFGDGSPHEFRESVSHTYTSGGVFTVILNVTDDDGMWDLDITSATISDLDPGAPSVGDSYLGGSLMEDVKITWSLSPDDGGVENDVVSYDIYYGTSYDPSGGSYALLVSVPAGSMAYVHAGGGHGDQNNYFYSVCAVDEIAQMSCGQQAAKTTKHLSAGMQLLSIPLVLSDTSTPNVLQTVSFQRVIYYDAMAGKRHNWKTFDTRKPYTDLKDVNNTMALWVEVTADSWFTVAGLVPTQTTIHLVVGWNFVGYCSFIDRTVADSLAGATYQTVETFDPTDSPYFLKRLNDSDFMQFGEGYWIHVSEAFDWAVAN
jgi:hypothetical protein